MQYCDQSLLLGGDRSSLFGDTGEVLSLEHVEKVFAVTVLSGRIGDGEFFVPSGKLYGILIPE